MTLVLRKEKRERVTTVTSWKSKHTAAAPYLANTCRRAVSGTRPLGIIIIDDIHLTHYNIMVRRDESSSQIRNVHNRHGFCAGSRWRAVARISAESRRDGRPSAAEPVWNIFAPTGRSRSTPNTNDITAAPTRRKPATSPARPPPRQHVAAATLKRAGRGARMTRVRVCSLCASILYSSDEPSS